MQTVYKPQIKNGFTLVELLVSIAIISIVYVFVVLQISNKPFENAKDNKRKEDINVIAEAYTTKAIDQGIYKPLNNVDFYTGKLPTPPEGGVYQGLLNQEQDSFIICAQLEKGKDINCLENSDNVNCYCRKSSGVISNPSSSSVSSIIPSPSTVGVRTTESQLPTSSPSSTPIGIGSTSPQPTSPPSVSSCNQTKPASVTLEGIDGTWCNDSDGNGNYSTAGTCVDKCSNTGDYCEVNGTNRDGYCSGTWIGVWFNVHCEFGGYVCPSFGKTCSNNACVTPQITGVNVSDSFNRTNNSYLGIADSGHGWIPVKGQWGISNNIAYPISISGFGFWPTITYAVVDTGLSDGTLEVTLSKNIQDARIPFRLIDENNNYFVERDGLGYHIEKTVNGERIELTPREQNATFVDGDKVKIQLAGSSIKVYINNSLLLNISDSTFQGTKHGIGTYFDKNMRFDDFSFSASSSTPTSTPTPSPAPASAKRVFVTSTTYNGDLGGLSGADAKCQARADVANLGGIWKAWLSNQTISSSSRLDHSNLPYKLLDGTTIANNWSQLISTDKTIFAPIKMSELKTLVNNHVWTNTNDIGGIRNITPENTCSGWTSTSSSYGGFVGDSRLTYQTVTWTDPTNTVRNTLYNQWTDAQGSGSGYNDYSYCNSSLPLYCFEQ